jgi:MarR family transcriptional regulator, transcriptional regulator for hemolysin
MKPPGTPIGLQLASTARTVGRAFNQALNEAGGSLPIWLILSSLKGSDWRTQLDLARSVGIEGPTLTRHLDGMEQAGLVKRRRHPDDRRAFQVELTAAGEAMHTQLLKSVISFNTRLRRGITGAEVDALRGTLERMAANVREERGGG